MSTPKKEPKVLIACPTLGLNPNPNEWLTGLLSVLNNVRREGFTHACLFPYRQLWWESNNFIWSTAFGANFDYILRMDDDVHNIPHNAFTDLLSCGMDVIGAAYPSQHFPYFTCACKKVVPESFIEIHQKDIQGLECVVEPETGTKVVPVDLVGFGMTLIKVEPFRYLERPLFKGIQVCPDDSYFAQLCLDNKIQQYVHFGVKLAHRHVNYSNNGALFNSELHLMQEETQNAKK